ncbi:MAG: hypothetical protein KC431_05450, partial [Myxococcales bacterium]|nr:hypothetical protein [Myxococcales bacterium]
DTGTDTTDTGGALSYAADIHPLFLGGTCRCHGSGDGGFDLADAATTYADLVGVPAVLDPNFNRVEPGDATNSFLVQKIAGTQAGLSVDNAQMPKSYNQALSQFPMSDAEQMLIAEWIDQGAAP